MRTYAKLAVLGMLALGLVLTGEPAAASPGPTLANAIMWFVIAQGWP